ncbi:hypothetical protein C8Q73DRAFT_266346 [Cubamyces lactineus]|nr:hypothetical protein C8Q73DRAFT_266346 [Cubamyces lactineus]
MIYALALGGIPGFSTIAVFSPSRDLSIVVLINADEKAEHILAIVKRAFDDVLNLPHSGVGIPAETLVNIQQLYMRGLTIFNSRLRIEKPIPLHTPLRSIWRLTQGRTLPLVMALSRSVLYGAPLLAAPRCSRTLPNSEPCSLRDPIFTPHTRQPLPCPMPPSQHYSPMGTA